MGALPDRLERKARNEALLREVNERIAELGEAARTWEPDGVIDFVCECGANGGCGERIRVPLSTYERLRSHDDWFVLRPGHETPEIEHAIDRTDEYVIVDKVAAVEHLVRNGRPDAAS